MKSNIPENHLARWLSGELSTKEISEWESKESLQSLTQIISTAENLPIPASKGREEAWQDFAEKISQTNTESTSASEAKVVSFPRSRWLGMAVAAAVAVLFAVYLMAPGATLIQSPAGAEPLAASLPDGSSILLNGQSSLSYQADDWNQARELSLTGEAYFEVEKGKRFLVTTPFGNVQVLGTRFNVFARDGRLEVVCYEGKVEVLTANKTGSTILLPGSSVVVEGNQLAEQTSISLEEPNWKSGEFSFQQVRLPLVLSELERQFTIQFTGKELMKNQIWTGVFFNNELENALQMVGESAGIRFEQIKPGQYQIISDKP